MISAKSWKRRSGAEWRVLLEAAAFLLLARLSLRLVKVATIVKWIHLPIRRPRTSHVAVEQCRWAVKAFSRNAPIRLVCFPQALALHAMLRRRRIVSDILYGVARMEDGILVAHVWLRYEGKVILGGETSGRFSVLDTWSPRIAQP